MIIPQIAGMVTAFIFSYMLGRSEQKRLNGINFDATGDSAEQSHKTEAELALARPKLIIPNIILIVIVIGVMISGKLPPAVAFMIGTAIAMIMNYPDSDTQRKLVDAHAMEAMLMASVLFAAGALMGIFQNSGMAKAMAETMVSVIPSALGEHIPAILGYLSMPLSLAFDPDSYYFAVMPVIAKATEVFGANAVDVARASIVGQITVGFPISPLTPSTFLLVGLAGVELGDHQKFAFKYLFAISAVIMTVALLLGVIPL
jgi:CitMHS family citrate-Mg2+:H+ or citrate-Ca2+:H+ symporter